MMQLTEGKQKKNIQDVLSEPVIKRDNVVQNTNINANDFGVTSLEEEEEEEDLEEQEPEQADQGADTNQTKVTETVVKKFTPEGNTTITETKVVENTEERQHTAARVFKPQAMLLMWDLLVPRLGSAIWKDTPKEHWKLDPYDKNDLALLLSHTAQESNFSGIATKWLLILAIGIIIFMKVRTRNDKPAQINSHTSPPPPGTFEATLMEVKAKEQIKALEVKYEDTIKALEERNARLEQLMKEKGNSLYYQELKPEEKIVQEVNEILRSSGAPEMELDNLDKIQFTPNGARYYPEKAGSGDPKFNKYGVKIGTPSRDQKALFEQWKDHHKEKSGHIPYFIAQAA